MKTFKQLLWFIVPTVVIAILFIFSLSPAFDVLHPPQFVGFKNYLRLLLDDDIFLKSVLNSFILFEIYILVTIIIAFIVVWGTKKQSNTLKFIIAGICGAISVLAITALFHFKTVNELLLKLKIIKEPFTIAGSEISIVIQVFMATILLSVTLFLFLTKNAIDAISNKKWIDYTIIAVVSFVGYLLYNYITTNFIGYASANYSVHTIVSHLQDYGKISFFNTINIFQLFIILQITVMNCFLFWCGDKMMKRMKQREA